MSRRTRAREAVFQLLYQDDLNGEARPDWERAFLTGRLSNSPGIIEFAAALLAGVRRHRSEIDALISSQAHRWQIDRMPAVDRNILRLAVYEIRFAETPKPVAIDQAITIAKRYGGQQTYQFINGILDQIDKPVPVSGSAESNS